MDKTFYVFKSVPFLKSVVSFYFAVKHKDRAG